MSIRALYVDDEPALLDIAKLFLEESGEISVDIAPDVREAEQCLASNEYDVVISDYQMPAINGLEFLKRLRSRGCNIPFILFTGRGREEVVIEALNSGADFYLQKGGAPVAQFTELKHYVKQGVQRHRSEKAMRESEERFRGLVENSFEGISVHVDQVLVEVNRAFCEITGYSRDELIGMRIEQLYARSSWGTIMEKMKLPVAEPYDIQIVRKNGYIKRVKARGKDITWNGKKARFSTVVDLPNHKAIEKQLIETESILHNLIEVSPDIVWEVDTRGTFTYISSRVREVLGFDEYDLIGKQAIDFTVPGLMQYAEDTAAENLREQKVFISRFEAIHKDGRPIGIEIRGAPFMDPDGRLKGFRGIARKLYDRSCPSA